MFITTLADLFIRASLFICLVQSCITAQHAIPFFMIQMSAVLLRAIMERHVLGIYGLFDNLVPSFSTLVGKDQVSYVHCIELIFKKHTIRDIRNYICILVCFASSSGMDFGIVILYAIGNDCEYDWGNLSNDKLEKDLCFGFAYCVMLGVLVHAL